MQQVNDVVQGVHQLLIEQFEIEADQLTPDAKLRDDLDLDSLDAADLLIALEKKFGVRIAEEEARQMKTVGEISAYVQRAVSRPL